jgi:hypothetical protein
MSAGSLQRGYDVGDGFAHTGDLGETSFGNQHIKWDGEGGQTICRAGVGLGSIWIAAAQRGSLRILAKQPGDLLRVGGRGHPRLRINRRPSRGGRP